MIPLRPVANSSQIAAYAYDPASGVLAVQFHNSAFVYQYRGVSADTATEFEKAESKGKAFASLIRNKYDFARIDTSADTEDAEPMVSAGQS